MEALKWDDINESDGHASTDMDGRDTRELDGHGKEDDQLEVNCMKRLVTIFIMLSLIASFAIVITPNASATDYTFGSENIVMGETASQSNRDTEDGTFETITETDQQTDTNYSGTSENIVTGTTGGGSFPSALDTDDATRRNYIEADTGGGSTTYQILRPTSDGSVTTMIEFPISPTTHWDKADETTAGGDGDTTYLEGVTNLQESELGMSDPSDPGGAPNIDVTMWQISRGESTSGCTVVWGIEIGGVEYQGGSTTMTSTTYANFSYEWTLNPATSTEWTLTAINGLGTYIRVTDSNPDTRTTQLGLRIEFNPSPTYQLNAQITYSSVTSNSDTSMLKVIAQGYRNGDTESVKIQAWNYTSSAWVDKVTISTGSDADYNFNLLGWNANCERSSGNVVLLRLIDASNGDATQTTTYLDMLKINRVDLVYKASVEMTSSSVPAYGDIDLKMKGKSGDGESWNIDFWNYTGTPAWNTKYAVTTTINTLVVTDIYRAGYISSGQMKVRFDNQGTPDLTQSVFSLDWLVVTHNNVVPTITVYGVDPDSLYFGETAHFFAIYSDVDNDTPVYVRVVIDSTPYDMTANDSDTDYWDGKTYYLDKSDIPVGIWDFYFAVKDADHSEVTSSTSQIEILALVNNPPILSSPTISPGNKYVTTLVTFGITYSDGDNESPTAIKWREDAGSTQNLTMTENDTEDTDVTDGKLYYIQLYFSMGIHYYDYYATDGIEHYMGQNGSFTILDRLPTITNYGVLPAYGEINGLYPYKFFLTYTDLDNNSPETGYPKAFRYVGVAWPAFAFVANDSGDTNYADGKAYYYDYYNYPVVGLTQFKFEVKSNGEAIVWKWPINLNAHLPSSPIPFHIFPVGNEPGEKVFTFNYTSGWGYPPIGVNVTVDGVSHSMIANDTLDLEYRDGKDFYFEMYINTSGLHNYSFQWTETTYSYIEHDTGIYWFILEEPTNYNRIGVGIIITGMLVILPMILFWRKKPIK